MGGIDPKMIAGLVGGGAKLAAPVLDVAKKAAGPVAEVVKAVAPPEAKELVTLSKDAIEHGCDMGKSVAGIVSGVSGWASKLG